MRLILGKDRTFGMTATLIFQMTFHTGYCETVLFEGWKVSSVGGLIGSMIGIFIMAALYEGLKYYRYNQCVCVSCAVLESGPHSQIHNSLVSGSTCCGRHTTHFSTEL
jgi:hypothetical protein